jgi:HEAT repeat protein
MGSILRVLLIGAGFSALALGQSLEVLLAYLKSPNVETRRDAARKLGERRARDPMVTSELASAARDDPDYKVRSEALKSLGKIKDPTAIPAMIGALKDPSVEVRLAAIRSLAMLYIEHGIDFITNFRGDWNWINPFLDTNDRAIVEPFVSIEPSIISALGEASRGDDHRDVRVAAIRALGVLRGRDAIPQMADAMNADREVRIEAVRAFIKIGDQAAAQYLVRFFNDSDEKLRAQAMVAAGLLKYRPAVEPLIEIYRMGPVKRGPIAAIGRKIKGSFTRLQPRDEIALWALSLIGDQKAEQIFVENLRHEDSDRRRYAFEGLARLGNSKYADQTLQQVLSEKDGQVRLAQFWALYKMGRRDYLHEVVRKLDDYRYEDQARDYLLEVNDPADLYPYLRSSDMDIRLKVVEILGQIGDEGTLKELGPILRASGRKVADAVTLAIKRIEWRLAYGRPRRVN